MPALTRIPTGVLVSSLIQPPPCDFSQIEEKVPPGSIYWKGESSYPSTQFILGVNVNKNYVSSTYLQKPAVLNESSFTRFQGPNYFSRLNLAYRIFKQNLGDISFGGVQSENFGSNSMVDFALQSLTNYFSKSNFPLKYQTLIDSPFPGDSSLFLFEDYADRLCYLGNPFDSSRSDWTDAQHAVRVWLNETDILGLSGQLEEYNLPKTLFNILYFSGDDYVRRGIEDLFKYGSSTSVRYKKDIDIGNDLFAKTTHILNILFMLDYLGEMRLGDDYFNTPTIVGLEVMNFSYLTWMKDKILDTVGVSIERESYQPLQEDEWFTTTEDWEKNLREDFKTLGVKSPETISLLIKVYDKEGALTKDDFESTVLYYLRDRDIASMLDATEVMLRLKFKNEIPTNIDTILKLDFSKEQLIDFIVNSVKVAYLNTPQNDNQNISTSQEESKSSRNYMIFGIVAGLGLTYYLIRRNSPN